MRLIVTLACAACLVTAEVLEAQKAAASRPASRPAPRALTMRGIVFEDLNANGTRETGEPPLANMPVSDGLTIVKTPPDGSFEFGIKEDTRGSVFVCTPAGWRASKWFYVIADFDRYANQVQPADIGLVRDPARNTEHFRFVQLSDTHVTQVDSVVQTMIDDLGVVNRLSDPPTFVVATGDLVNVGREEDQIRGYARAILASRYPIYSVVGNHDYGGRLRDTENYEKHLGPPYYSFDVGPYHFIAKDIVGRTKNTEYFKRQQAWIEEDLRLSGAGKRVIVFQHFIPLIPELDWWAERNTAAVFSGHWHGRRERLYKGILDVNSSTLRFGGIDRSPRGFRIIHVDGNDIRSEWRVGRQEQRIEIVSPPLGGQVGRQDIPLRVVAYDTAVRVKSVRYRIFDSATADSAESAPRAEGELWIDSSWSWAGRCAVPPNVKAGSKRIEVEATGADGSIWRKAGTFSLADDPAARVRPGQAWPFFHNDAGHRGYLPAGPEPPLTIAWATNIGGTIHISSPVIAEGCVYAASSFEQSLGDCAVTALDLRTGRTLWRAPVDSSVKHSLAVWDGNIMAVSQAATLYCFDREGYPRWTASLDRGRSDRWETSFPVTDGRTVYAGRCSGFGAYDLATGKPLWNQPGGQDWWPSIYSGPSLGTGKVYQGGPFVRALDPAQGTVLWENKGMVASTVAVVPAAVEHDAQGDRLYVFRNEQTLRCLDGTSGKVIWEGTLEKPDGKGSSVVLLGNETGTPAVGEDIVCVGSSEVARDGEVLAGAMHGFDKSTGKLRWKFPVGTDLAPSVPYKREVATITSSPVIVGHTVYFGASDGYLYALGTADGTLKWKYWFGMPIASTPAISGNTLILATWDGTIYALTSSE